jgi:cell shape-determining protein MreC
MKVPNFKRKTHLFKDLQFTAERLDEVITQTNDHDDKILALQKELVELREKLGIKPTVTSE